MTTYDLVPVQYSTVQGSWGDKAAPARTTLAHSQPSHLRWYWMVFRHIKRTNWRIVQNIIGDFFFFCPFLFSQHCRIVRRATPRSFESRSWLVQLSTLFQSFQSHQHAFACASKSGPIHNAPAGNCCIIWLRCGSVHWAWILRTGILAHLNFSMPDV